MILTLRRQPYNSSYLLKVFVRRKLVLVLDCKIAPMVQRIAEVLHR